jgi:hypothetical protein
MNFFVTFGLENSLLRERPLFLNTLYGGVSLLSTASKLYANILKNKLNIYTEKYLEEEQCEEQCGFRKGRSNTDAIFTLHQIFEKIKEFNLPTYILFLDYEKAYDKINRKLLWTILREASVPMNLIKAMRYLYSNTYISIQGQGQQRSENIKTKKA